MNQNNKKYFRIAWTDNPLRAEIKVSSDEQSYITNQSLEKDALIEFINVLIGQFNDLKIEAIERFERDV